MERQVVLGPTGHGQYGGTWNSDDGKTQVKAGVDFNNPPKLGWHADAQHQIYNNPSDNITVDAFAGANQQFNQLGKRRPDTHGGIKMNFRSDDGKSSTQLTQVKARVDYNNARKLDVHADAQHQIYKAPSGITTNAYVGAQQQMNQVGKKRPNVHGGINMNIPF